MSNDNKELTVKASSDFDVQNPILSEQWFAEALAAFEAALPVWVEDEVECSYCFDTLPRGSASDVCPRCTELGYI